MEMNKMKKIFATLLSLLVCGVMFAQGSSLEQADAAYAKGDFQSAITLYQEVAAMDGVSSDLYYNIGNAFYKAKEYPQAILNYERALLLDPRNSDAAFNLQIAKLQTVDKIEPVGKFFLAEWYDALQNQFSSNTWAVLGVIAFLLFMAGVALYVFSSKTILRKLGFFGGIILIVICIFSNIFAAGQKDRLEKREYAIVFAPTITVKSSPADSGTDLFVIHEGTKVKVKSTLSGWSEIELEDGNIGWLPSSQIEII